MTKYSIPVLWQEYGYVQVEADTAEEAADYVKLSETPLPSEHYYVDDSFEVDEEFYDNPEDYLVDPIEE